MIAPLAPALPPLGAGALVIPRYYLINPTLFRNSSYDAILTGGAAAAGAKPPRASDGIINGFLQRIIFHL